HRSRFIPATAGAGALSLSVARAAVLLPRHPQQVPEPVGPPPPAAICFSTTSTEGAAASAGRVPGASARAPAASAAVPVPDLQCRCHRCPRALPLLTSPSAPSVPVADLQRHRPEPRPRPRTPSPRRPPVPSVVAATASSSPAPFVPILNLLPEQWAQAPLGPTPYRQVRHHCSQVSCNSYIMLGKELHHRRLPPGFIPLNCNRCDHICFLQPLPVLFCVWMC
ncbi:unnamed protein product, partial [Urochloa humidicola]